MPARREGVFVNWDSEKYHLLAPVGVEAEDEEPPVLEVMLVVDDISRPLRRHRLCTLQIQSFLHE